MGGQEVRSRREPTFALSVLDAILQSYTAKTEDGFYLVV